MQMAPYNKLGSTSVASENAVARYCDNITNPNMQLTLCPCTATSIFNLNMRRPHLS
jgi:hypothetical protein